MLLAHGYFGNRSVSMFVTPEEKKLLSEYPLFSFILYDWKGYGNDYTGEVGEISFEELTEQEYQVLSKFRTYVEHNQTALEDIIRNLKHSVEQTKFLREIGCE